MSSIRIPIIAAALLLAACANHDGRYEPACIAYEGDTIDLRKGRFEWDRFTDQRSIDAEGKVVDPFPDYPKAGAFRLDSGQLAFVMADGTKLARWHPVTHAGRQYLLTTEQHDEFMASQAMPDCALRRTDEQS